MRDYDIFSLICLNEVYTLRSITQAGERLSISKVAVSKRIAALEQALGMELFARTTRALRPTLDCERLMPEVQEILARIEGLYQHDRKNMLSEGTVRLTATNSMAHHFLASLLADFQRLHPKIQIDLVSTNSILNLTEHNIDLTVRVNPGSNLSLVGKKVGGYRLCLVGSPGYLKRHKKITSLEAAAVHPFLCIDEHFREAIPKKLMTKFEAQRYFRTNDSSLVYKLLVEGEGIGLRSNWDTRQGMKEKKLVEILPEEFSKLQGEVWLLGQAKRLQIQRVRLLFDYLEERIPRFL